LFLVCLFVCLAYTFSPNLFILVAIAETVKQLKQSLSHVLDEVNCWPEKSPPAQKTVRDSPSASRCRAKMRSLEDQLNKWRCGIGQGKASRRRSTGGPSGVDEEPPALVDCDEPDQSGSSSENHSRSQGGGGVLEVHYESTVAENGVGATRVVGRRRDRCASMSSVPLETSLYRPEECFEAGPNAFRSKEAVPATEFTPLHGTDLESSITSFQTPKSDYLEATSPVPRPQHRRASMGSVLEDCVQPAHGAVGKWHGGRRSSMGSIPTPTIESDQTMGRRGSLGLINGGLTSPRSGGKRRSSLGSGKIDIFIGRRPSGVSCDESYSNAGAAKHGGAVVSRRGSVGSHTGLLVREGSRSSVSTGLNSCDASRASVGTGIQSSDASRASVGSWVSPKSVFNLREGSCSNAGKTHHAPIGSSGSVSGSIDSRKGFNDSHSTILTGDSSMGRSSKAQHAPIGSPGSVTGSTDSRKNAHERYRERSHKGSCSSEGKSMNTPLRSPGSVAGCIDSRRGADGSRRQRSHRKLSIGGNSEAPSRTPSDDQASLSNPRSTNKRRGSGASHRRGGSKRDLLSKDHDAESSRRSLRSGKIIGTPSSHGSEKGTDPDTRRKHSRSERKESMRGPLIREESMRSMIAEVEDILSSPLSSSGKKFRRSDRIRHKSSRKLDSKESGEPAVPRSQRKERRGSMSSPRLSSRRSSMGAGGSSTYYSEVGADQLRGLKQKSRRRASVGADPRDVSAHKVASEKASKRRASVGADPRDVSAHKVASEKASKRQERSRRASTGSLADGGVEKPRRRQSRRSSVGYSG
jgi:hypothetical protein